MLNKIHVLGSSSSGCAYTLHFDKCVFQLDAGVKNTNPEQICRVLISHQTHKDHDKYIGDFKNDQIIIPSENKMNFYSTGDCMITSFPVPHRVLNNGYIIDCEGEKVAYITDCGDYEPINIDLSLATYLLVEVNWDYFLVNQKVINVMPHSSYAFSNVGHMSNLECLNAIAKWKVNKDCKIIFIHKSSAHANYDTTYKMFDGLPNQKYIAKKGETLYTKSWKVI